MIAAASSSSLAAEARAGDPPRIVISQIVRATDGATSRVDTAWVDARLTEELDAKLGAQYEISRAAKCDEIDPPCPLARARRRRAAWLVRATLVSESDDHHVRLEVVRPSDGYTAAIVEETCEICGRAELEGFLASTVGTLRVRLDGLSRPQEPVKLERIEPPAVTRSPALKIAGITTLGVGAATGVAGAVLWGMDGRPHRASCDTPDARGECPNMYSSRTGGIALTAVGAAALGVGAALLVVDRVRRGRDDAQTSARLRFGGASLKWSF